MKIVSIHQPEHMPWLGFFNKMSRADVYILLDSVQYKTGNWQNRNRIVDRSGRSQWLTVPCLTRNHMQLTICDIAIDARRDWRTKYKGRIRDAYRSYPYYEKYCHDIFAIVDGGHTKIADLNFDLINYFRGILGLEKRPEILRSSQLAQTGKATDLLVSLIAAVGGEGYIAGADGAKYMEMDKFVRNGIEVFPHCYRPFAYSGSNGYHPCMSTLDALFSLGADELVRRDREYNDFGATATSPIRTGSFPLTSCEQGICSATQ